MMSPTKSSTLWFLLKIKRPPLFNWLLFTPSGFHSGKSSWYRTRVNSSLTTIESMHLPPTRDNDQLPCLFPFRISNVHPSLDTVICAYVWMPHSHVCIDLRKQTCQTDHTINNLNRSLPSLRSLVLLTEAVPMGHSRILQQNSRKVGRHKIT